MDLIIKKVVIELQVMQYRVLSNRTRAAPSFDFEITRMISDQTHPTQLNYHY